MSSSTRIPLERAEEVAGRVVDLLAPACDRIEIVGSIRRGRPLVGDVEILASPQLRLASLGLFKDEVEMVCALSDLVERLLTDRTLELRRVGGSVRNGGKYKALTFESLPLDLFICTPPAQWGVLSVIRTGPAEFSQQVVRVAGHFEWDPETGEQRPGFMPPNLAVRDGALWRATRIGGVVTQLLEMIETPTEESFFEAIGRPELLELRMRQ